MMTRRSIAAALLAFWCAFAGAVELGNSYFQVVAEATSTSTTFVTPTGAEILGSNLDASSEYILIFIGYVGSDDTTVNTPAYQILENGVGQVPFSYAQHEAQNTTPSRGGQYMFMARVTTAATPNDYEFQFRESAGTNTVHMAEMRALAWKLDDLVENTDYCWDDDSSTLLPTNAGFTNGAACTVGNGTDDFLIFSTAHALVDSAPVQIIHRIDVGGTPFATISHDSEDTVEERNHGAFLYAPDVANATVIQNQFSTDSATSSFIDIDRNRIFILNLTASFEDYAGTFDAGPFDLTSTDTTYDVETLAHTTNTAANRDWFVFGGTIGVTGAIQSLRHALFENTGAVTIAGVETGSSAPKTQGWSAADRQPALLFGPLNAVPDNTNLDIDLKIQEDVTAGADVNQSSVVAFSLELLAASTNQATHRRRAME